MSDVTIFKDQRQVIRAILTSFRYNYQEDYLIDVCEDVKNRLLKGPYRTPTEEGHIIMGLLVLLYGDYGTSPRYGWMENKLIIPTLIEEIDEFITECKEVVEYE